MSKIRIAMIGAWGHGGGMLGYIEKCRPDFAEIVALGQVSDDETFENYKNNFAFLANCPVYTDYRELLQQVKPDIAVVSAALKNLPEAVLNAAEAGCHIYAEKPIAATLEQLETIESAIKANGAYLLFTMGNPASRELRAIRELYETGKLGSIAVVNARKSYPWNDDRVQQFPLEFGGTIGWVGMHALEFIHTATGKLFTKVTGMESNVRSDDFSNCPDNVVLSLALTGGGHASVSIDYCRPGGSPVHGDDWIRVVGTKATAEANLSRGTLLVTDTEHETGSLELPPPEEWFGLLPKALADGIELSRCADFTNTAFALSRAAIIAQQATVSGRIRDIEISS